MAAFAAKHSDDISYTWHFIATTYNNIWQNKYGHIIRCI